MQIKASKHLKNNRMRQAGQENGGEDGLWEEPVLPRGVQLHLSSCNKIEKKVEGEYELYVTFVTYKHLNKTSKTSTCVSA